MLRCTYTSDLPYHKKYIFQLLLTRQIILADYPPMQCEDFSHYIFGVPYSILEKYLHKKQEGRCGSYELHLPSKAFPNYALTHIRGKPHLILFAYLPISDSF